MNQERNIKIYNSEFFKSNKKDLYLYISKLKEKYSKVFFLCSNEDVEKINKELWNFSQTIFIPHLKFYEIKDNFEKENTFCLLFKIDEIDEFLKEIETNKDKNSCILILDLEEDIIYDEVSVNKFIDNSVNLDIFIFLDRKIDLFLNFFKQNKKNENKFILKGYNQDFNLKWNEIFS